MFLFHWLRWILAGKPTVKYDGASCGLCGRWYKEHYEVPTYKADPWIDTWGLCPKCATGEVTP